MRIALASLLLLAPSLGACAVASPHYWVGGTADYAMTSVPDQTKDESGATPVRALYCEGAPEPGSFTPVPLLRLSDACVLHPEHAGDICDLPTVRGPLRVVVSSVSLSLTSAYRYTSALPMNVVVGGTTVGGGRYVTYRFTGTTRLQDETGATCRALARDFPAHRPAVAPKSVDRAPKAPDPSSWQSGILCTAQGCAD